MKKEKQLKQNQIIESYENLISNRCTGEAWMYCKDCNAKLYSFDGDSDTSTRCPHPEKC